MDNKKVLKTLVDNGTGEYVEIYEGDKLIIKRKEQSEAIQKAKNTKRLNKEMNEWNNELGGFVFVLFKYCDKLLAQHSEITSEDITKLFYLATFVDYEGYLVYNEAYMSRVNMNELLHIHISSFDAFFNKMKKLNIFIQDDNKNIKINKECFSKGEIDKDIKKYYDYTRVYINTIRYLFENVSQREHKQLGTYFKIIPYIHRQQNVLCWNPNSRKEDLRLMNLRDLKDILGYTDKGVRGVIKKLLSTRLENGEPILGFFITDVDFWKSVIIVNPKVFYGGNFDLKDGRNMLIKWFNR